MWSFPPNSICCRSNLTRNSVTMCDPIRSCGVGRQNRSSCFCSEQIHLMPGGSAEMVVQWVTPAAQTLHPWTPWRSGHDSYWGEEKWRAQVRYGFSADDMADSAEGTTETISTLLDPGNSSNLVTRGWYSANEFSDLQTSQHNSLLQYNSPCLSRTLLRNLKANTRYFYQVRSKHTYIAKCEIKGCFLK